jgi:hypothetical protein
LKKFILLVTMTLASMGISADWAIKGEGNFSCPDYVSAKRSNTAKLYSSATWVQGFISGVNYQSALEKDTDSFIGQDFPATSIVRWLENYCHDNPQDYLSDAAEMLVVELKEKD